MGKTSYMNTEKLVKELSKKIEQLNKGELNLEELNDLVNQGKDLYEQLVVLRYKAFDKYGEPKAKEEVKPVSTPVEVESDPIHNEEPESTPFDFTDVSNDSEEEESQPVFDFSMTEEKEEVKAPLFEEKAELKDEVEDQTEQEVEDKKEIPSNSLNDSLKNEDDLSLRKKLQNSPISDIKTHISIGKKFEYISNMFSGNSEEYDEAIDFLNTCATGKDAQLKLNEYATNYNWDLEDKSIIKFIELVERRYV